MLVCTLVALLRSRSARNAVARSGGRPRVMKTISAASTFFYRKRGFVSAAIAGNEHDAHGAIRIEVCKGAVQEFFAIGLSL